MEINDSIKPSEYHIYRELVCELCRHFYEAGWVTGTGGSISIKYGSRIYMTPSGVQKERIKSDELYVLDMEGGILARPEQKPGRRIPKLTDCSPLFLHAFVQCNAGAVLHSHGMCCNLVTCLFDGQKEFRISHQEMIKGIAGYGYHDELVVPIIENTAYEYELADCLGKCIKDNPKSCAVLVRRHGLYVWGDTWEAAKRHGECLHYLFEMAIQMHTLSMDFTVPPTKFGGLLPTTASYALPCRKRKAVGVEAMDTSDGGMAFKHYLFDIEGTTTPITFVKDVLFPYAANEVASYLGKTWDTELTKGDVKALYDLIDEDLTNDKGEFVLKATVGRDVATKQPKDSQVEYLASHVKLYIQKDRKIGALKQLQGHIWNEGYESGTLQSIVYDDVPPFFAKAKSSGAQVNIYSSGSREAQHSLFKYSDKGDLRTYLSAYFDTKVGLKRESGSYKEILMYLGADKPSDVCFVTDIIEEAIAASEVGIEAVLSVRPGNAPLPKSHQFKAITAFDQLV
jgi:methylthioribulose 1-phosphate dehydratase/enolase-phosphatase E1